MCLSPSPPPTYMGLNHSAHQRPDALVPNFPMSGASSGPINGSSRSQIIPSPARPAPGSLFSAPPPPLLASDSRRLALLSTCRAPPKRHVRAVRPSIFLLGWLPCLLNTRAGAVSPLPLVRRPRRRRPGPRPVHFLSLERLLFRSHIVTLASDSPVPGDIETPTPTPSGLQAGHPNVRSSHLPRRTKFSGVRIAHCTRAWASGASDSDILIECV